jgi:hypothetical protein
MVPDSLPTVVAGAAAPPAAAIRTSVLVAFVPKARQLLRLPYSHVYLWTPEHDRKVNSDGTMTIYAITALWRLISGGEPDPTKLVTGHRFTYQPPLNEEFQTLAMSKSGEVFRGVAFFPAAPMVNAAWEAGVQAAWQPGQIAQLAPAAIASVRRYFL